MSSRLLAFLEMKTDQHRSFQRRKDTWLQPVLQFLHNHHIQAQHISLIGLSIGLLGLPLLWYNYWLFVVFEIVSLLCDGLDGPLARFSKTNSPRGAILDFYVDLILCISIGSAVIIWLQEPILVLQLNSFGLLHGLNWLAGSPLKTAPGRMLMVITSALTIPTLGIVLGGLYSMYMLGQLWRHLSPVRLS